MKKQIKGIFFAVIFGGGLLFWATTATIISSVEIPDDRNLTLTGTPQDNFADEDRLANCGAGEDPKNTKYIKEYRVPTKCTQPHAITITPQGDVWFAQSNTGSVTKFDPVIENFTEYNNPFWPPSTSTSIWGMDYSPDNKLWFTDPATVSIWQFSIDSKEYNRIGYPSNGRAFPQQLSIDGSRVVVNDLQGGKISFLDLAQEETQLSYNLIPSPLPGYATSGFDVDYEKQIWFANWSPDEGGILIRLDAEGYIKTAASRDQNNPPPIGSFIRNFAFPAELKTPNGIGVSNNGIVWLADTSSSNVFSFNPFIGVFTAYPTSMPSPSTYGNATGIIKNPLSRPYWVSFMDDGKLVFNEHAANKIAVLDTNTEKLIEYIIPSNNPEWADCQKGDTDCGIAQAFSFATHGQKIWFTEWAENNIGVVDTSVIPDFDSFVNQTQITLKRSESIEITLDIIPNAATDVSIITASPDKHVTITADKDTLTLQQGIPQSLNVTISVDDTALYENVKVLLGAQREDIVVSQYITVTIEQ